MYRFVCLSFGMTLNITYGMLKCDMRDQHGFKSREIPNAINASIREIPVTISEFSIGMLLIPMTMVRGIRFMLLMPMAAIVPMTVAIRATQTR